MSALRLDHITRYFGRRKVIDITADVAPGAKVALLGPNGSGKTTLLRIAAGVLRPTSGSLTATRSYYLPQDAPIYPELTGAEHLRFTCQLHEATPDTTALGPLASQPAGALSRGQRQRLHLEMALQSGAELLLLDEPFTALDAEASTWLESRLAVHPGAVLMSLHDEALAQRLCQDTIRLEVA